ncbi:MAG: hypothetical protein HFH05_01625 [Lachnospiraceae bacterium]|nr:hypothetical protein [Lachnospiraceae bacterium]
MIGYYQYGAGAGCRRASANKAGLQEREHWRQQNPIYCMCRHGRHVRKVE